jgi:hypothetical protein
MTLTILKPSMAPPTAINNVFMDLTSWLKIRIEQPASDDGAGNAKADQWGEEFKGFHIWHCTQHVHGVKRLY